MKPTTFFASALFVVGMVFCQDSEDAFQVNSQYCGRRYSEPTFLKIISGDLARPKDWGWQVLVKFNDSFICGGSLINSQWVLTAAHCFGPFAGAPSLWSVSIGLHDREAPEEGYVDLNISRIVRHNLFHSNDYGELKFDIGLMKLSAPVNYTDQIVPVCIPDTYEDYAGRDGWVTGWGQTEYETKSRYLLQASLPILSDVECLNKLPRVFQKIELCAGENYLYRDSCYGDSGGPLVSLNSNDSRWYLLGIVSYGDPYCLNGGVYTRTSTFIKWILDILKRF